MASDQFDNNNKENKVREVTQDSRNTTSNRGRRPSPASLSFDFENKPASPSSEVAKADKAKNEAPKEPERAVVKAPDASAGASASDKAAEPKKQYGLPEEYRKRPPEALGETKQLDKVETKQNVSDSSEYINKAKVYINRKLAERKEAHRHARAEAAERRRQQAREEAVRKAEEAQKKAEEAARAAERGPEYEKKLDAAVNAEIARASSKKAVKPQKSFKQGAAAKVKAVTKTVKEKNAAKKADTAGNGSKKPAKLSGFGKGGKNKKRKQRKKWVRIVIGFIEIMIALAIIGGISGVAYAAYTISHADEIHPDQIYNTLDVSTHIYDDQGNLTDDIYLEENREIVQYDQLPDNLKNAFIAIEDKTFWTHKGFNVKRIFGAIWNSVSGGGEISGTSTITQQLARNVFLPEEKSIRSIKRKIIEMYYAYEIEEQLSKEEILTAYLNTIYLGYGCYGVDTASKKYFGVDVEDLTLEQCAALAALPQAPGVYALLMTESDGAETTTEIKEGLYANDISINRRYLVLDLMAEQGYITAEEAEAAKKPLAEFINPGGASMSSSSAFKDYLLETVKKDLMTTYALSEEQADKLIYTKGLNIYSTLDSQAQKVLTKQFKNKDNFPSAVTDDAKVEAAMVITEVGTGQIKAMAGTRSAEGDKLFNRATSPRQPGSSIKPLAVYAAALQKSYEYEADGKKFKFKETGYDKQGTKYWGNYITASSGVTDEKMKVNGKTWPKNFGGGYSGYKTFRQAIQLSINTCAVKILAQVGEEYSMDMVKKFGITTAVDDTSQSVNDVNLAALGLGAMTEGVTPLEMALAYATFPNGGVHNSGICYTLVTDHDGKVLLEGKSTETKVLDEGVAYIMTDILQSVVSDGIAYDAAISGEKVGGKTGTTDETWDIWFDGFTANYAAALWIGTDDNVELNTTSATAAKLWSKIMKKVDRACGGKYKSKPDNVVAKNGELYTKGTQPPDPPKEEKKEESADHSSTAEPDPNAVDNTGNPDAAANAG